MEDEVWKLGFSLTDPEGNKNRMKATTIQYCDNDLSFLLSEFKHFLLAVGYAEVTVSRLQYLEDEEWKYVLQQYDEWKDDYERLIKDENHAGNNTKESNGTD